MVVRDQKDKKGTSLSSALEVNNKTSKSVLKGEPVKPGKY